MECLFLVGTSSQFFLTQEEYNYGNEASKAATISFSFSLFFFTSIENFHFTREIEKEKEGERRENLPHGLSAF